ncbi:similar to Saccharomyces cerevisiae YDR132C Putative protein of unknown function [Maudiozyma barnettii]|uniref:BTB domain-containing protein n=1 Tax=Maudiozyma barnettii TaxID=61262 RepID=A0A8H2VHK8_9SACH|nr:Mrx16p [Kazachstania barnettii]CAB4255695.1 similar to Saccharomyces cerevisiae YDR132C Putative protein of unknown function [Kazachstania barnettii]CAD1784256.1 similar to Saccharomyces cerevisiae YDR132C Putative protein of unknown function [Kazachstania barnettii]
MDAHYDPTKSYFDPNIPQILPHENMYKIQIGSTLFKISGASLSSDGPSYFTDFFAKLETESTTNLDNSVSLSSPSDHPITNTQSVTTTVTPPTTCQTTLFIDRSAEIFKYIYQHLQGYYIDIKDEVQYTMLIADSMYYNLPRLRKILRETEYYYTKIGDVSFKLPKSLFDREGDTYNYFYLTSDTLYVDIERVIISRKLIRPPPHSYSFVPRSPHLFKQLFELLCGAQFTLDDNSRESLIKECRYYRLLNLEQRLIKCKLVEDPIYGNNEIWIKLNDISKNGLSVIEKPLEEYYEYNPSNKRIKLNPNVVETSGFVKVMYKKPYVDLESRILTVQIDDGESYINIVNHKFMLGGKSRQKFESLFNVLFRRNLNIEVGSYLKMIDDTPFYEIDLHDSLNGEFTVNRRCSTFEDIFTIQQEKVYIKKALFQIIVHSHLTFIPVRLDTFTAMTNLRNDESFL